MSFAAIRKEVVNVLKAVEGIGVIHDYRRHTSTWAKYLKTFKKKGIINAWEVSRTSMAQDIDAVQGQGGNEPLFQDAHAVQISGYMSLDDAAESEKTFQDLIDRVVERLRKNNLLNRTLLLPAQPQVTIIEHRMFGDVLVHFAEIVLLAIERVGGSDGQGI